MTTHGRCFAPGCTVDHPTLEDARVHEEYVAEQNS